VSGLKPDTRYFYRVSIGGKPVKMDPVPSFRTFPSAGKKASFQIIFGGGSGYVPEHERMWDTMAKHDVTAFLALGDKVYVDRHLQGARVIGSVDAAGEGQGRGQSRHMGRLSEGAGGEGERGFGVRRAIAAFGG